MSTKIEWFVKNCIQNLDVEEYIALKNNIVVCRVKREKQFSGFWVAHDVKGDYLFRDQYRSDVFKWVEDKFKE